MLDPIVFMPHREDSLGARLLSWLLLTGLWLPGGQTGKGQLPSWFSSWSWLCVVPLLAGAMPLPNVFNCGILKWEGSDQSFGSFLQIRRIFGKGSRMGVDVVAEMLAG